MSFILVIIFIVPWLNGKLEMHDSTEVINLIEALVLGSATLSVLTFTYIAAMSDLHERVKKAMVTAGECFFISTVQFIVGLSIFLFITLTINHFIDPFAITLSFNIGGIISLFLLSVQLMGIYEIASALSKFLKGIYEIYKSFRVIGKSRIYSFIEKWSK
ncbi:MAG: hypothetical protein A4E27_00599 [Methanobacterium sp. PtaU1.Bin242]|nr:MAG: hypothetical protein A4E27_00599 [Methanobacterium sp. PtaU1.Bin242]